MPYDISEIKKLSTEEKLQIIDELWDTIEPESTDTEEIFDETPEVAALLQERIAKYERGDGVFYTSEDAIRILKENLEDFRSKKNG